VDIRKKKQKNVKPGSPNSDIEGEAWLFSFITRGSYLIVAYEIGKRTRESCKKLFEKVFNRVQLPFTDVKIQIFSDGNDDYTSTIPEYYSEDCVDYGQLIKIREGGKVVDKIKKVIYGTPNIDEIETTDIENMNSICRERLGRFVRKTKCFSKKKTRLVNAFELFNFYWNFMDKLTKTETPGMLEGLADHQWNWEQFFNFSLSILN
jgi:IS1 family transposase